MLDSREIIVHILYINTEYDNEVSLDKSIDSQVDSFGDLTWRTLISDIMSEDTDDDEVLEDEYGIKRDELDNKLTPKDIDQYYSRIEFYEDNTAGPNADAFNLIRSLKGFSTDRDGNGTHSGVELLQTTANGPRKYVYIHNGVGERWLIKQFNDEGLSVKFIRT